MEEVINQNEIKQEIKYSGVKKGKIAFARFVDLCIFIILALITVSTTVFITAMTPQFTNLLDKAEEIQLESHLYELDKEGKSFLISDILNANKDMKVQDKNKKMDENLTYFFSSDKFFKEDDGIKIYNDLKKDAIKNDKHLFVLVDDKYVQDESSGITPDLYYEFYRDTLLFEASPRLHNNSTYHHLSKTVARIFFIETLLMSILTYIALFFFVPFLSFKNHNTLGFKTFKIGIVDNTGFVLKNGKAALVCAFSTLVIGLLSVVTFFVPLIISMGFFIYRQDNKNLTAYLFDYYYVDITNSRIYKNEEEYLKRVDVVEDNKELFKNTPLEVEEKNE